MSVGLTELPNSGGAGFAGAGAGTGWPDILVGHAASELTARRLIAQLRACEAAALELEADQAEGRSWYLGPGAGELVEWRPVLNRPGVQACPTRVASAYLELAVLVRALQGLSDAARIDAPPDASSLWAGLFDLRDTLLGSTVDDLRALAA